jgi:hypothetical protein
MATLKEYREMTFYARSIAVLYTTALGGRAAPLVWPDCDTSRPALPFPAATQPAPGKCRHTPARVRN